MDRIIYDCDNTFGVPERPVDDGLALLYLLGHPRAEILGVTTTYGNSTVDVTYDNTKRMLRELGRSDIPVLKGGASKERRHSEAAEFLADLAGRNEGRLRILATGALTNLFGAYKADPDFFGKIKEIVLMGGVTEPLFLNGVKLDELNFSCDPEASCCVLTKGGHISIATGNNCLPAYIRREDFERRLMGAANPIGRYICEQTRSWFDAKVKLYGLNGFYVWDGVAAACLLEKKLFARRAHRYTASVEDLRSGFIGRVGGVSQSAAQAANLPVIRDADVFRDALYMGWTSVRMCG
jgi:purine nucleosidase